MAGNGLGGDADLEQLRAQVEAAHASLDEMRAAVEELAALSFGLMRQVAGRDPDCEKRLWGRLMAEPRRERHNDPPRELEVYVSLSRRVAPVAARVFRECLIEAELLPVDQPGLSVGISGGRTISEMLECVEGEYGGDLWLIPLSGSRLPPDVAISVNTIIGQFCTQPGRANVKGMQLPLDPRIRRAMAASLYDRVFGRTLRRYYLARGAPQPGEPPPISYAFTGVGSLDPTGAIPRLRDILGVAIPEGTVGDMLDWPIDEDGNVLGRGEDIEKCVVGIAPDDLREGHRRQGRERGNLRKVVVVAGSDGVTVPKDQAILAAWRGGLFDVLATDVLTAELIIERPVGEVPQQARRVGRRRKRAARRGAGRRRGG